MTEYGYKTILSKAKTCKTNVMDNQKCGISYDWSYYFAKALITPKKDVKKINISDAPKPSHTYISRQMSKATYLSLAKKFVKFVEDKHRLPNYLSWNGYKISQRLYTYTFARCLVYLDKYGKYDPEININEKVFNKPTETGNVVYDYFAKKTGKKFKTLDDLLAYVKKYWHYEKYFDDKKSNQQVIDTKGGNCVDLLQFCINYAKAMDYECKCIHVKCRVSGTGHVFGKFKHPKNTENTWIVRDIASVADGGDIRSVWCRDGIVQAENPSWFLENLQR